MYGAYQLQADVSYVQRWLHEHIEPADVRQSALALDVFKYFCTAVDLLKRQPRARSRSRSRNATQNSQYFFAFFPYIHDLRSQFHL